MTPKYELLVIERDSILELEGRDYSRLQSDLRSTWNHPLRNIRPSRQRRVPAVTDVCLAIDTSRSDFWFEFEPQRDLNLFLDWSCLATYDVANALVSRCSKASLREELNMRTKHDVAAIARPFLPVEDGRDGYGNFFVGSAAKMWTETGHFFGKLAVCGCELPGCAATYAWLEGNNGLLLVEIIAAGLHRVEIGPFTLATPSAAGADS
jgi:hypothetical protein